MQESLARLAELTGQLLEPQSLAQLVLVVACAVTGLGAARMMRGRGAQAGGPGVAGWLREGAWIGAPYACGLIALIAVSALLHGLGRPAQIVDVAARLGALLLLRSAGWRSSPSHCARGRSCPVRSPASC